MLDKSKLIGIGRNSEIYEWEDGKVIKLLMEQAPQEWADIEARFGHDVQSAGLPVPYFGEVVEIDGRRGFMMEHVKGASMLETLGKQPWRVVGLARLLAKLHVEIHACPAPADWLDQRDWLKGDIIDWLIEIIRKTLLNTYLNTYFAYSPKGVRQQFGAWRAVNVAAFISWF